MSVDSKPNHYFVGREAVRCITDTYDKKHAFFTVGFGAAVITPTHYTLRHYITYDDICLRNWEFEGSNDGQDWTTIKTHTNDESLSGEGSSHTWKIEGCNEFYSQ
eukprot:65132_1